MKKKMDSKNYERELTRKYRPAVDELWDNTSSVSEFLTIAKVWKYNKKRIIRFLRKKNLNEQTDWDKINAFIF